MTTAAHLFPVLCSVTSHWQTEINHGQRMYTRATGSCSLPGPSSQPLRAAGGKPSPALSSEPPCLCDCRTRSAVIGNPHLRTWSIRGGKVAAPSFWGLSEARRVVPLPAFRETMSWPLLILKPWVNSPPYQKSLGHKSVGYIPAKHLHSWFWPERTSNWRILRSCALMLLI